MKLIVSFLFLSFLLISCSPKLQYTINVSLSGESFTSRSNIFTGKIPLGWFSSHDTSATPALESWILRHDLSAAIAFREIHVDQATSQLIKNKNVEYLAELSQSFSINDSSLILSKLFSFTLGNDEYCSYEIKSGAQYKRIVVFMIQNRFFECEASTLKGEWKEQSVKELYTIQQSVLASLLYRQPAP